MRGHLVALAPPPLGVRTATHYHEAGPKVPCDYGVVGVRIVVYGPIEVHAQTATDALGLVDQRGRLLCWWDVLPDGQAAPAGSTFRKQGDHRPEGVVALEVKVR